MRAERRLVLGRRARALPAARHARHRRGHHGLDPRHRERQVEVVAVGGVDVGAQPQAGVGHADVVRGMRAAIRPSGAVAGLHRPTPARRPSSRALHAQAVEPGRREGVVVVARHDTSRACPRSPRPAPRRAGATSSSSVRHAALAQLEHVAEQHHVVGAGERIEQAARGRPGCRATSDAAQESRGAGRRRALSSPAVMVAASLVSGACRASAATTGSSPNARSARRARCSIRPAARAQAAPALGRGQALAPGRARRPPCRARAGPTRPPGPTRAAPRCASSGCPGGSGWREWHAGQIARSAP